MEKSVNNSSSYGINQNIVRSACSSQPPGSALQSGLGCSIMQGGGRAAVFGGNRADVDYPSPPLFFHIFESFPGQEKRSGRIKGKSFLPRPFIKRQKIFGSVDS